MSDAGKGAADRSLLKTQTEKTLRRDDYSCRFCGFRSLHYQRVIPWPEAGGDLPFMTCCTFCEQCLMLDRAGMMGSGTLIWLPEIGQAELNHIARAAYVARAGENEMTATATRAIDTLMARRTDAKKRLGSDDPLLLATVMHEALTPEDIKNAGGKLDGVRLLPFDKHIVRTRQGDANQFPQMIKYWLSPEGPFAKWPAGQWGDMFKTALAAAGHA